MDDPHVALLTALDGETSVEEMTKWLEHPLALKERRCLAILRRAVPADAIDVGALKDD